MTALNGHAHPIPPAAVTPAEQGSQVELNPKRLGPEGNQLLGQVQALSRWATMFAAYAQKTLDLRERQVLLEVSKALFQNAESFKVQLAQVAVKRGAGTISTADDDDEAA
jgi:hypothetical protein